MLENNIANARILGYVGDFPCNMLWRHVIPIVSVMIFVMSKHQSTGQKKTLKKKSQGHPCPNFAPKQKLDLRPRRWEIIIPGLLSS